MRYLVLTRGVPGSGKSTFLKENNLDPFVLSPDAIRLIFSSPVQTVEGTEQINPQNDRRVWSFLFERLEERMMNGDFTIIDATHCSKDSIKPYKALAEKYRYHVICLDFSDIGLQSCIERDEKRQGFKKVGKSVIQKMHDNCQKFKIPSWIKVMKPDEFLKWLPTEPKDLSQYESIYHIGDIQGCYTVLKDFLELHPITPNNFYIFTGDYIDRGIENDKVVNFILQLQEQYSNVILLQGNHDIYLWQWASGQEVTTQEFNLNTKGQLEEARIDKAKVRNFCRNLRDYFYYTFKGKTVIVTHGGLANVPKNFKFISTKNLVAGSGVYRDYKTVDDNFVKNTTDQFYSIHGHRNVSRLPTQVNEKCFNLEGGVEEGYNLRTVKLNPDGNFEIIEIKNSVYNRSIYGEAIEVEINHENQHLVEQMRSNKLIQERGFVGDISSFNFTRDAFSKKIWNDQTIKARGLFINTKNYEIVARSYDKFFNIGEMDFTEFKFLKDNLKYPVQVYEKENGFLGILGFNTTRNQTLYCSKSSIDNDFAMLFKEIFLEKYDEVKTELRNLMHSMNLSFIFEVIDPIQDPHIVEYDRRRVVLLDAVKRQFKFEKMPYSFLQEIEKDQKIEIKKLHKTLYVKEDFERFYFENINKSIETPDIEGFVLEDDAGQHVKLKLPYYSFWKSIRGFIENRQRNPNSRISQELKSNGLFQKFYDWYVENEDELANKSLIEVRRRFVEEIK